MILHWPPCRALDRTTQHPEGALANSHTSNRYGQFAAGFAEQAFFRESRRVATVLVFLEDFGGHLKAGPASRGEHQDAGYFCQLGDEDQMRPVRIMTNLAAPSRCSQMGCPLSNGRPIPHYLIRVHFRRCPFEAQFLKDGGFSCCRYARFGSVFLASLRPGSKHGRLREDDSHVWSEPRSPLPLSTTLAHASLFSTATSSLSSLSSLCSSRGPHKECVAGIR